jgi:hypothetical protein
VSVHPHPNRRASSNRDSAAVAAVNDSPYGIQAGLFTNDMRTILHAFERIEGAKPEYTEALP